MATSRTSSPWVTLIEHASCDQLIIAGIDQRTLVPFKLRFDFVDRVARWHVQVLVNGAEHAAGFMIDDAADPTEHLDMLIRSHVIPSRH